MKRSIFGMTLVSLSVLTIGSVFAAGGVNRGFFLGVNAGSSKVNLDNIISSRSGQIADFSTTKNPALAFGIDVGYVFNKYIGLQFSLNKYQQISASRNEIIGSKSDGSLLSRGNKGSPTVDEITINETITNKSDRYKLHAYIPALSLLLNYPINEKWAIYGQAGIAVTTIDYETTIQTKTSVKN